MHDEDKSGVVHNGVKIHQMTRAPACALVVKNNALFEKQYTPRMLIPFGINLMTVKFIIIIENDGWAAFLSVQTNPFGVQCMYYAFFDDMQGIHSAAILSIKV